MTKSFEETYPKYPFSRLVRFGVLFASHILSVAREGKSKPGRAVNRSKQSVSSVEQSEYNG